MVDQPRARTKRRPRRVKDPRYPVPTPVEESALVRACLDGDAGAWRRLIARYETVIHLLPRRFGLGDEDSAEIFQAVCLALFRGLPRLKLAAGLTRWVLTTTWRQTRDLARRRRREVPPREAMGGDLTPDPTPGTDELLEEADSRVSLRAALESLSPRCRQLLTWLYLEDEPVSYREIARRLGSPEGTIGPTRARCLARLREIMEREGKKGTR